jgi:hypothetical protein
VARKALDEFTSFINDNSDIKARLGRIKNRIQILITEIDHDIEASAKFLKDFEEMTVSLNVLGVGFNPLEVREKRRQWVLMKHDLESKLKEDSGIVKIGTSISDLPLSRRALQNFTFAFLLSLFAAIILVFLLTFVAKYATKAIRFVDPMLNNYWRSVGTVLGGVATAQAIPIIGSVIIARIYIPAGIRYFIQCG